MFKFSKIDSKDEILSRVQDNIAYVLNPLLTNDILSGNIIKKITFQSNIDTKVSHGLDRPYLGYFILTQNNFGQLILSNIDNTNKKQYIILQSNSTMEVDLYVF